MPLEIGTLTAVLNETADQLARTIGHLTVDIAPCPTCNPDEHKREIAVGVIEVRVALKRPDDSL